jgi:hypothetical protein
MSDLTCRCTPASTTSAARLVSSVQSNYNSIAGRVTDLETEVADLDDRVSELESNITVNESPFVVVDNEAEVLAALPLGKILLWRGEGNDGEISLTAPVDVDIRGTKIWGYGYKPGATGHFSKVKFDHPVIPNVGSPNLYGFKINAADIEIAGLEVQGNDALDLAKVSYIAFRLSTVADAARFHLHDVVGYNLCQLVGKDGSNGAAVTTDLTVERVYGYNLTHTGVGIQNGARNPRVLNSRFIPKPSGFGLTFTTTKGIFMSADIHDALIDNVYVEGCAELGIEFTSTPISGTTFNPMLRNKVRCCKVCDTNSFGISMAFPTDGLIESNLVENVKGIGIESTGGSSVGQSNAPHNAIMRGNIVRGVTADNAYASGIVSDKTFGDIMEGNHVYGVASTFAGANAHQYARGLLVYEARLASVRNNKAFETDGIGCYVHTDAAGAANAMHTIEGNDFYVSAASTKATHAMLVFNSRAVIRNNTAWEPVSGIALQKYECNINLPQTLDIGFAWTAPISGNVLFDESNLRLTY